MTCTALLVEPWVVQLTCRTPRGCRTVQDSRLQYDVLAACVALTAHRRFSEQFVEAGGVQLALALPR